MSPILDIQRRYRELGRIRMGEKGAKGQPVKLTQWRLTSSNRGLLEVAAALWGGQVKDWTGGPDEGLHELHTATGELPIVIPPGREPVSQWMEQWTRGGCTHRCDGQRNTIDDTPCSCSPEAPACKPTTRLSVMLPDLPDVGVWRLESHGWNAAAELPGTVEVIRAAAERGQFLEGRLRIEERSQVKAGKTSRFIVPVLDLDVTMRQLVSGGPRASLETGVGQAALPAPDIDTKVLARDLLEASGDPEEMRARLAEEGITHGDLADPATLERVQEIARQVAAETDTPDAGGAELFPPEDTETRWEDRA